MATISEMFTNAINEANKAAKGITDPGAKAQAYAAIAQALAQTGGVAAGTKTDDVKADAPANVVSMTEGKDSLKNKPATSKATPAAKKEEPKAAPAPAPAPAAAAEPELTEEWTEEAMTVLGEELAFIQAKQEQYGDEAMDDCVKAFSDEVLTSIGDINPLNIKGFVAYIQECEADQASA